MPELYVGIDLGGTKIIGIVINNKYQIIDRATAKTGDTENGTQVIARITSILKDFTMKYKVLSVGIGSAGFVDFKKGIVALSPNIKFLRNYPLASKIEGACGIRTFVENDVKAGAIYELFLGQGSDVKDFIFLTLGTGIGAAIVVNRSILRGRDNLAGEIGHFTMDEKGIQCGCGKKGCLETISSGPAIRRYVLKQIEMGKKTKVLEYVHSPNEVDVVHIANAASQGDMVSKKALSIAIKTFAKSLSYAINLLNPEKIILGGGLFKVYKTKEAELVKYLQKFTLPIPLANLQIVEASIGEDVVATGAALIAMKRVQGKEI